MRTDEYDFELPPELIAQHPVEPRDQSRLLVVHRGSGRWEHRRFADLPELLGRGDLLVRNASRVVPARLVGVRARTGGRWEGLFLKETPDGGWELLSKARGRLFPGERIEVAGGLVLTLLSRGESGGWIARPESLEGTEALLQRYGQVPLPPYIRKGREGPGDRERYQTVYARVAGSVAAPTAGLHFTPAVFEGLRARGAQWVDILLHVGIGTFRPITAEHIEDHVLHEEEAELSVEAADRLNAVRASGGRILAVGTTSARTLETSYQSGAFRPFRGATGLYLAPGHAFAGVDALLTNFHLPRSSLLVLVSAFAGTELVRAAYVEAIRQGYRFYSYGDAMLVL